MKHLLMLAIRLYWVVWPRWWRNRCLFEESCSQYVFRHARDLGFWGAVLAFQTRFRKCRPGYCFLGTEGSNGGQLLLLADGSVIADDEMAFRLRRSRCADLFEVK
ncbi:MAG: membrane protein insertion efficiency factor YidD [Sphingomonadales bacterium]|nr:MAG: membrane protein insertion efficiency factor YidD [Sphingomonadales bacterium]